MSKTCSMCEKGTSRGHTRKLLRGHYNITSRRSFKPNLQKTLYQGEHIIVCTKCLRTLHKEAKQPV